MRQLNSMIPRQEMSPFAMFDDYVKKFFGEAEAQSNLSLDIAETEKEYLIKADLPGVKKEEIRLSVDKDYLTIEAARREERDEKTTRLHYSERYQGSWRRSLYLGEGCNTEKISASMQDGVLTVTVPKTERVLKKEININ